MDWSAGYHATWRVFRVDRRTWADAELVGGVSEVEVERTCDEDAPLLERGSMVVDAAIGDAFQEGYYRVVMTATQGSESRRVDVATLLCCSVEGDVNRRVDTREVLGRSVLYPASVTELETGSYVPAGVDCVSFCAVLLRASINAPIVKGGSFVLDEHLVFDGGTTVLGAVWKVLDAGGYVIQIAGDGTVSIGPKPTDPALVLDRANARLLHPTIHHQLDYSEVPNRYIASDGGDEAVAVNDDPSSMTSTVTRGWVHDVRDDSPTRVNGETLTAYAQRRLEEESMVYDVRTYTREWWPDIFPFSVVRGSLASVDLDGDLRVVSQTLTCGLGITVEEQSRRETYTWRRA